jgi:aminoglycoside phosphotransferase (APT) family kinase protein
MDEAALHTGGFCTGDLMGNIWDADIAIDEDLAVALLQEQFPELCPIRQRLLGEGWDNVAFAVNDRFVFRFPRRQIAVELMRQETLVLPLLAPHLPLPVPVPTLQGQPGPRYAYPFAGYQMLSGITACRVSWTDDQRIQCAESLAAFLASLHHVPVAPDAHTWAPGDFMARTDLRKWLHVMRERADSLSEEALPRSRRAEVLGLAERLSHTPPWTDDLCWVHGDLYARHLLVDEHHQISGIIDWGDVHLGDPALDLSIAFSFLPPSGRDVFRRKYGMIDDATWDRARFRALHYGIALLTYGRAIGDREIEAAGAYALENAGR